MTKQELIDSFYKNHLELLDYIVTLTDEAFSFSANGKWTAGQQLSHVYLCLQPISQALGSKEYILQKFGKLDRETMDYEKVILLYTSALENGGKAPERFVPELVNASDRIQLRNDFNELLLKLNTQLGEYSEDELNTLILPHPLLGNLCISELMYLMTYHATHHLMLTKKNL